MTTDSATLLPEHDAAAYLGGIPPRTLRQWRHLNTGPSYVKVGAAVRYRRSDLDAWLAANTVTPNR